MRTPISRRSLLATPAALGFPAADTKPVPVSLLDTTVPGGRIASCADLAVLLHAIAKHGHPMKQAEVEAEVARVAAVLHGRTQLADQLEPSDPAADILEGAADAMLHVAAAAVGFSVTHGSLFCSVHGMRRGGFTIQAFRFPDAAPGGVRCVTVAGPGRLVLTSVPTDDVDQGGVHDCVQRIVFATLEALPSLGDPTKRGAARNRLRAAVRAAGQLEGALSAVLGNLATARTYLAGSAAAQAWLPRLLTSAYANQQCAIPAMKPDKPAPAQETKA